MIRNLLSFSRRRLAAITLLSALAPLWAQTAATTPPAAACPPVVTEPTPEQMKAAHARARDHGALWRISRDGRDSWLYGSLHIGKLEWSMPGPRLTRALRESDSVALELDLGDPATAEQMLRPTLGPAPALPSALAQRLARQRTLACVPDALSTLHPILQVSALSMLDARWIGLDPGFGVEHVLTGFARSTGRPLLALETPAIQLQALLPSQADESLRMLEQGLSQLESGLSRRVLGRLAQAWADGDLNTVSTYEDWCDCVSGAADREALHRLNDARNPYLADRIASLHGEGRRLFAAVGLLHMTGEQALPRLLAERGFNVERVPLR